MYPMVYMCTINDTKVTTTIIIAVRWSMRKPTCMVSPSLTNQVYTVALKGANPS